MRPAALLFTCFATTASAEPLRCAGAAPDWVLTLDGTQAEFVFPAPTEMEVKLETQAEGQDWPRAFTLIGPRDTAILLLDRRTCGHAAFSAHVLTQRGDQPILLTGCCQSPE